MAFTSRHRSTTLGLTVVAGCGLLAAVVAVPAAQASPERRSTSSLAELTASVGADGSLEDLTAPEGRPLARPSGVPASASDTTVARAHLEELAPLWGLDADPASLEATGTTQTSGLDPVVRFTQRVDGVPVHGGEFVVALDDSGDLLSVSGSIAEDAELDFTVSSDRAVAVARAAAAAKLKLADKVLTAWPPSKSAYAPALVGEPGTGVSAAWHVVITGPRGSAAKADVFVDATDASVLDLTVSTEAINRAVCDAGVADTAGSIGESYDSDAAYGWCGENATDIIRDTNNDGFIIPNLYYSNYFGRPLDSSENVSVPFARSEGQGASGVTDVNEAYNALGYTSDLFGVLGVELTTKIGAPNASVGNPSLPGSTRHLSGVVRYCEPREYFYPYLPRWTTDWLGDAQERFADPYCPYENAYWADLDPSWTPSKGGSFPGGQMFIGEGLAKSEDVIGHELAHGVTSATNGLIYKNESGAINESMSDVFGQLTQEYKFPGTDPAWLVGDKLSGPELFGPIRNMSNPTDGTLSEGDPAGQPDSMTSFRWDTDPNGYDAGGVHTNSGVGNKAAWLIAHGGTFNGVTVSKLDQTRTADSKLSTEKVAWLYWRTQQTLPSNANYRRLAAKLSEACRYFAGRGEHEFVASDCTNSVDKAVVATRMTWSKSTLTAAASTIKSGASVLLTARVGDARNGSVGGVGVKLQKRTRGSSTWTTTATANTSTVAKTFGKKYFSVKPNRSTYYRVVYTGSGIWKGSTSSERLVSVTPKISKNVSKRTINYKKTFKVTGKVSPKLGGMRVYLQRYSGGKWRNVKSDKLSGSSAYSMKYKPKSRADRNFRVYLPSAPSWTKATSSKFRITVR